ncbi:MAG: hypothetical protein ACLFNQ_09840 [Spirochaetaceae bacterium]
MPAYSSVKPILSFWAPLAVMWLIMGIEQPTIGAVITRLPNATQSLAAFEVAFGLATLIHSPVIHILSASTALAVDRVSFRRVALLLGWVVAGLTLVHGLIAIPDVFRYVAGSVLNVPDRVVPLAQRTFLVLLPISAAVGFRRMIQGALIRVGATKAVGLIMVSRLAATTFFLGSILILARFSHISLPRGELIGAIAFVLGVVTGLLAAIMSARPILDRHLPDTHADAVPMANIIRVYVPLALTAIIVLAGRPLVIFAIGRSNNPTASLAAWPIIQGYVFLFIAVALSFQEVVVARTSTNPDEARITRRLGIVIGAGLTILMSAATLTRLDTQWFRVVIGVPGDILPIVLSSIPILLGLPLLISFVSILSGTLVAAHKTASITFGTIASILIHVILGLTLPVLSQLSGAYIAATIMVVSSLSQVVVQYIGFTRVRS